MTDHSKLPRALRANALLSLMTGLAGLLMSAPLSETVGLIQGTSYQVVGGLVLLHVPALLFAGGRATVASWAKGNITAMSLFALLLLGLLGFAPIATPVGAGIVGALACLYAALALWQLRLLRTSTPRPAQ